MRPFIGTRGDDERCGTEHEGYVVADRAELGLRIKSGRDVDVVSPLYDTRYNLYWTQYHELMGRKGISPGEAKTTLRTQNTVIAALMVRRGEADAMLCGAEGPFIRHLRYIREIINREHGVNSLSAVTAVVLISWTAGWIGV